MDVPSVIMQALCISSVCISFTELLCTGRDNQQNYYCRWFKLIFVHVYASYVGDPASTRPKGGLMQCMYICVCMSGEETWLFLESIIALKA